jgi:hypothetical protein
MRPLLLLAALFVGAAASAQTVFTVTVANKTSAHPYFGQGHPEGYVVNGVQGAELTLVRNQTYTFQLSNVAPSHPFYVSTDASGGGLGAYTDGVTGTPATGNATVTFTVPLTAPNDLWYQCTFHGLMGFRMNVIGPGLSGEGGAAGYALAPRSANPGRGAVRFAVTLPTTAPATVEAFAADGRRVAVLYDGTLGGGMAQTFELDTAGLASGVYVVRARSGAWEARQTVTLVR